MKYDYEYIASLVEKIKQKNTDAFVKLYELSYQSLYYLSFSILKNKEDAEDALQDSYMKILQKIDELKDGKAFFVWAKRITYSICIRMLEKKKPDSVSDDILSNYCDENDEHNPEGVLMKQELENSILSVIDQLPALLRSTVIFKYYDDFKIEQIAEIMDCPVGTVKSRLYTAKNMLKKLFPQ